MENSNKKRKVYVSIGSGRLLIIRVVLDDIPTPIYEGRVEDAPEEIKDLKYSKVNVASQITYYVYSDVN